MSPSMLRCRPFLLAAGALAALALPGLAMAQARVTQHLPADVGANRAPEADAPGAPLAPPAAPIGGALGGYQGGATTSAPPPESTDPGAGATLDLNDANGETPAGADDGPKISYDPQGRRDPFRPLTGEAADTDKRKQYEGTLRGLLLAEVKLTSIVHTPRGNIATFEGGPKKEGYVARVGDQFWNGTVVDINFETKSVVIREQLNDPRLLKPYRDQVIELTSEEDKAKEAAAPPQ